MVEFYPEFKWAHVVAVFTSGGLFLLRSIAVLGGMRWGMAKPVRFLSYGIDTVLLLAAMMLVAILPSAVFANGWLWVKLGLLVVYIVLGMVALKRGRTFRVRLVCSVAALLVFAAMLTVARTHHPLGALKVLLS